jgi:hypothetical protein
MARARAPIQHGLRPRPAAPHPSPEETTAMSHLLDPQALHTDAEYRAALAELEQLLLCDPGTPAGHRLDELVALIEAYEVRGRRVELAADAELRRVWARAWATFGLPHDVPDAAATAATDSATGRAAEAGVAAARLTGPDDPPAGRARAR